MKLLWLCCENEEKPEEKTEDRKKKPPKAKTLSVMVSTVFVCKKLETLEEDSWFISFNSTSS